MEICGSDIMLWSWIGEHDSASAKQRVSVDRSITGSGVRPIDR